MNDLGLWIVHNHGTTWTRAEVPAGAKNARDLAAYIQRGGRIDSPWMAIPEHARFVPQVLVTKDWSGRVCETVLARIQDPH